MLYHRSSGLHLSEMGASEDEIEKVDVRTLKLKEMLSQPKYSGTFISCVEFSFHLPFLFPAPELILVLDMHTYLIFVFCSLEIIQPIML